MKNWSYILLLFLLASCGSDSSTFLLEGRLRNMNQGEFKVYSPDGGIVGIDTITVRSGRFSYEVDLVDDATLVIVFPNYSEQPVFAAPGEKVTIEGDATHLKEMIIQGTTDNEDMTTLRLKLNDLTPPDVPNAVGDFIEEHLESSVSLYLINRYFLLTPEPDYQRARKYTRMLLKEQPENAHLVQLDKQLSRLQGAAAGSKLPRFNVRDIKGRAITENVLKKSVNVVYTWATWNYSSNSMQQKLQSLRQTYGDTLGVLGICLDAVPYRCKERVQRDSLPWPVVCDGRMWDSPLMATFSLADVPSNVLIDGNGRIVDRNLSRTDMEERIKKILKK